MLKSHTLTPVAVVRNSGSLPKFPSNEILLNDMYFEGEVGRLSHPLSYFNFLYRCYAEFSRRLTLFSPGWESFYAILSLILHDSLQI